MAYNDAPFAKVPPFPDQFQELVEPICNPTTVGMNSAHTYRMTLLKRGIAVKVNINTEIAGFPRTHRGVKLAGRFFRMGCGIVTTARSKGGVLI